MINISGSGSMSGQGFQVLAYGTFTASSATTPADTGRTEGNDYFKGKYIMPLSGVCALQSQPIRQFISGPDQFVLDEPFTTAPGLVPYVILNQPYPMQRLLDIFNLVNSIMELNEAGGSVTTDGTEQTIYINNAPAAIFKPNTFQIDLTNMAADDEIHVRISYRIAPGGNLIEETDTTYSGVQAPKLKTLLMHPNRYGIKVTVQRTAGVDRAYNYIPFYEG